MLQLHIGTEKHIEPYRQGCLYVADEVPQFSKKISAARVFDPNEHGFNLLKKMDYKKACMIVDTLGVLFPAGTNTLTKEGVPNVLLEALLEKPTSFEGLLPERSKDPSYISAQRMIRRITLSPVLSAVLCSGREFSFNQRTVIFARINRAELTEFDARAIVWFLLAHYKGQLVIPDLGFYGRDIHTSLIREARLIAGVNYLDELPKDLRRAAMMMELVPRKTSWEDAVTLASYLEKEPPHTDGYDTFIKRAMGRLPPLKFS